MKRYIHLTLMAAMVLLITSCYKLISISAPREVAVGETFTVRMAVADDGSDIQNFVTDWSLAGIRVPKGWKVTMPQGAHEQCAEEWVYYENGQQVASRQEMEFNEYLTAFYEEAAPKTGYEWVAFSSQKRVAKHMTACWRNGCDSIVITFQVTVPEGTKPGDYTLDFLAGDEEDESGVYKYNDYASTNGSRLFHAGTITSLSGGRKVDNAATSLRQTIHVVEASAIQQIKTQNTPSQAVYDTQGRLVRRDSSLDGLPRGTYVVGGQKVTKK